MFKIHHFQDAVTSTWSGGKTTELFIYPENSLFSERNFDFRISSATIDVENSDFTSLPAHNRLLAILEGKLEIIHEGKYSKVLQQFEIDEFHGSWKTSSIGKVRDFNVIYSDDFKIQFSHQIIKEDFKLTKQGSFLFILILNESIEIEGFEFKKYDLIQLEKDSINLTVGLSFFLIELTKF
jgi:environmental stress-induced protein Ves